MSVNLSQLAEASQIADTDLMHLRTQAGADKKITAVSLRGSLSELAGETIAADDLVGSVLGKIYKIGYAQYGNPPLTSESNCLRSAFARLNDSDFICVKSYSTSQHVQYRVGRVDFTQTNWFTWLTSWTDVATSLGSGTVSVQVEPIHADNTVLILWGHVTNTDLIGQVATWNPATTTLTLLGSPSTILAGTTNPSQIYAAQGAEVPDDVFVVTRDLTASNTLNFIVVRYNGTTLSYSSTVATIADTSSHGWPCIGEIDATGTARILYVIGRTVTGTIANLHTISYNITTLATTYWIAFNLNGDFTDCGTYSGCLYFGNGRIIAFATGTRSSVSQLAVRIIEKFGNSARAWFEIYKYCVLTPGHNPRPRLGVKTGLFLMGSAINGALQSSYIIGSIEQFGIRPRINKTYAGTLNVTTSGGLMPIELSPGVLILPVANVGDSTMKMDVIRLPELLGRAVNGGSAGANITVDTLILKSSALSPGTEYFYDEDLKIITPNKTDMGIRLGIALNSTMIRRG